MAVRPRRRRPSAERGRASGGERAGAEMEKWVRWLLQFASKDGSLEWEWKRDIGTVGRKEGRKEGTVLH